MGIKKQIPPNPSQNVIFWPFDPAKNAIPRWCTRRRRHIPMAVMRGNRMGGNWLMKKFLWYTHRLMHQNRVTCELHDSYFHLMTIKHSISAIEWALNYYITQSRQKSSASWVPVPVEFDGQLSCSQLEKRCGRESHTRPKGLGALMSWGPEMMLIRCSKGSHHPAEWAQGLQLSSPGERERHNADGHKFGGQNIAVMFGLQLPLARKPWVTLFEPLQIKWEVNILLKKSSCVCLYHCVCYSLRQYVSCMNMYMRIQQEDQTKV